MNQLKPDCPGRIVRLTAAGPIRRRLLDLGFIPGAVVECLFRNTGNSLTAYGICGTVIALRCVDVAGVTVEYMT